MNDGPKYAPIVPCNHPKQTCCSLCPFKKLPLVEWSSGECCKADFGRFGAERPGVARGFGSSLWVHDKSNHNNNSNNKNDNITEILIIIAVIVIMDCKVGLFCACGIYNGLDGSHTFPWSVPLSNSS